MPRCVYLLAQVRRSALTAVTGDEVMTEFVGQAMGEAAARTHAMAADAVEMASTTAGARELAARGLPPCGSADESGRGAAYAAVFAVLLPRALRGTLQVCPVPWFPF